MLEKCSVCGKEAEWYTEGKWFCYGCLKGKCLRD